LTQPNQPKIFEDIFVHEEVEEEENHLRVESAELNITEYEEKVKLIFGDGSLVPSRSSHLIPENDQLIAETD
jgi:hypothetical protein